MGTLSVVYNWHFRLGRMDWIAMNDKLTGLRYAILDILMSTPISITSKQVYMWNKDAGPMADRIMSLFEEHPNRESDHG